MSLSLEKITSFLTYSVFCVVFVTFFLQGFSALATEMLTEQEKDWTPAQGLMALVGCSLCLIDLFQSKKCSDSAPLLPSALLINSQVLMTLGNLSR